MMPAGFSSLVGEYMVSRIPNYCSTLVKNLFHNGHPDLIPAGKFEGDAIQYGTEGIEVKAFGLVRVWPGDGEAADPDRKRTRVRQSEDGAKLVLPSYIPCRGRYQGSRKGVRRSAGIGFIEVIAAGAPSRIESQS